MQAWLTQRIGRTHLQQRIGVEQDYEARVFGLGRNLFHLENWYSVHGLIRNLLRVSGLYGRGRRNARTIRIERHRVMLPRLPAAFEGFRILQLSDLHVDMHEDMPAVLADAVAGLDYDICVLTGDFRARTFGPYEAALAGMRQLRERLQGPVYGILGNHDSIRMLPGLEGMGIRMLMNESVPLEREGQRLHLAGIDDPHYHRADNLEKAADAIPGHEAAVLLAHSPEIYRQAAYAGFDLMLCGHTHGGQICLPGGIPLICNADCPRAYCRGSWRFRTLRGYTSRGSGVSVVDVRLNCPPEITLHELRRGEG
ncbi:metallophosphoesterase [Thiohalobacter sp. IOR34]|uniref:metallophosphoesterase n=1 Tax=Thiohalobacter sp. IOR34 TaxID=3057176 RepID=UPI0025AF538B|nr:metallophosphoesterase [Thiohalobacter sp. IOR34]WJW74634.1 metallophosphoesterase [Thiohalobacter sp. IOR34]